MLCLTWDGGQLGLQIPKADPGQEQFARRKKLFQPTAHIVRYICTIQWKYSARQPKTVLFDDTNREAKIF